MFIIKKIVAILCVLTFTLPIKSIDLENKTILWLGTSIPEGCTYPEYVCKTLGLTCINKALGASFLCMKPITPPFYYHTGLSLSTSSEEKGVLCQQYLDKGELDDEFLSAWKEASYDKRIGGGILEDADIIIIDHGYNDGDILEEEIKQTKKQYDEIEEWFKKYGEAASNLRFFQEDAKSTFLKIKLDKLKAANNDIICY